MQKRELGDSGLATSALGLGPAADREEAIRLIRGARYPESSQRMIDR